MHGILHEKINAEFIGTASPETRIQAAELEIEAILKRFGCTLGISILKSEGLVIHQEIIVIDKRD